MAGLNQNKSLPVAKTIKLFINGEFPRTESGRSFPCHVHGSDQIYAHLCQASRKDFRNAIVAAKSAASSWETRSAYNRGQILYRIAEMLEGKSEEIIEILATTTDMTEAAAKKEVQDAIDGFVYYAGFTDKYQAILGSLNPVNAPVTNFTAVEPMGIVTLVTGDSFAKACADMAASLCSGNVLVVFLSEKIASTLASLAEAFATSDLPKGVINLLSGFYRELAQHIATHMDVNAISFQADDALALGDLREIAIDNLKRVVRPIADTKSLNYLAEFVEYKTVWQTSGY